MNVDYVSLNTLQVEAENDSFTPDRYRQFFRHLPRHTETVLDVGCGTGRGGAVLKSLRPDLEIHGLDCLQDRLNRLPAGVYANTVCSLSTEIDARDRSYDAIVAGEFIEHVSYQDVLLTLREFYRVLANGGRLLMTTPYPDYVRLFLTGGSTVGGAHVSAHYPKTLSVMMADAGFPNIRWCGSGRVSRYLGESFPIGWMYGSFLIYGDKTG